MFDQIIFHILSFADVYPKFGLIPIKVIVKTLDLLLVFVLFTIIYNIRQ